MRTLHLVPALLMVASVGASCTGATAPQGKGSLKALETGPTFEINRQDVEAAYGYGHISAELAVESLGAGQTIQLDAEEISALAQEVPVAPLQ